MMMIEYAGILDDDRRQAIDQIAGTAWRTRDLMGKIKNSTEWTLIRVIEIDNWSELTDHEKLLLRLIC